MKSKVLVVATSANAKGGIATVVKAFRQTDVWNEFSCRWLETHIDGSKFRKFIKFGYALVSYLFLLFRYNIVHIHVSTSVSANRKYFFFRLARLYRKKIVVHLHCGSQLSDIWNSKYENMLTNADICLVLSQSIRDIVVERTGRKDNVEVLYNPCPTVGRKPKDDVGEKRILFAATLYREKGYLDLIDAFAKVYEKHPDWQLILAGNGSQEEGLMRINELGIQSGVTFLGWVSGEAKEREFRIASIFCLPSYAEGFPMAVLDAWAYGLPVVTTPVGGIPDIVIDGENGLLFNPGDKEALAIQLNRLIEDVELRNVLKGKSEELAFTIFNIKTIAMQLGQIYRNIK
jgi:glycosyltransferase involved in cell wall biosynthesis